MGVGRILTLSPPRDVIIAYICRIKIVKLTCSAPVPHSAWFRRFTATQLK